jgi:Ca2+-binding EF-hand superfamily protein
MSIESLGSSSDAPPPGLVWQSNPRSRCNAHDHWLLGLIPASNAAAVRQRCDLQITSRHAAMRRSTVCDLQFAYRSFGIPVRAEDRIGANAAPLHTSKGTLMNINGTGMPSMASMQQMQARMFKAADQDGSGGLNKVEFKSMMAEAPAGMRKAMGAEDAFSKIDTDRDGSLSAAEMKQGASNAMKGFQSTLAAFSGSAQAESAGSIGSSKKNDSSSDLIKQLLAQLQTQYSGSTSQSQADPLSMFA